MFCVYFKVGTRFFTGFLHGLLCDKGKALRNAWTRMLPNERLHSVTVSERGGGCPT